MTVDSQLTSWDIIQTVQIWNIIMYYINNLVLGLSDAFVVLVINKFCIYFKLWAHYYFCMKHLLILMDGFKKISPDILASILGALNQPSGKLENLT